MSKKSPSKRLSYKILNQFVPELKKSKFYKEDFLPVLLDTLERLGDRKIEQIICYGLGSFYDGTEVASRYQLALLLLIYDELVSQEAPVKNEIEIFDPSFEPADIEALKALPPVKFRLIEDNEHCARRIISRNQKYTTLIFMPHLDKHFYNNLLGANWYLDSIDRLVILGNSFQAMIDYETASVCRSKLYYINLLVTNFNLSKEFTGKQRGLESKAVCDGTKASEKALIELMIASDDVNHWEIFNNLGFHFISESWLSENKAKIEQNRLPGWDRVVATNSDSEWHED